MFKNWFGRATSPTLDPRFSFAGFHVFLLNVQGSQLHVLSFLPPELVFVSALPMEACMGTILNHPAGPASMIAAANFQPNAQFDAYLHHHAARVFAEDSGLQAEAKHQRRGNVFVLDARTPDPGGYVPPEDILGAFEVSDGSISAHSYRGNPQYRVVSINGICDLPPALWNAMIADLHASGQLRVHEARS